MKRLRKRVEQTKIKKLGTHFLNKSRISLWLQGYEDIFSDFDPRPYSQRGLADDFLSALKKGCKDKVKDYLEIALIVPKKKRNLHYESLIRHRLKKHFTKHFQRYKAEKRSTLIQGVGFILLGITLMFLTAFFFYKAKDTSLLAAFLVLIMEPGGWFLFWEGLDLVIFDSKVRDGDLNHYNKLSSAKIVFVHS